jgi:hypothetical protein
MVDVVRRLQTNPPIDSGWYYAQWKDTPWANIHPVWVTGSHQVKRQMGKGLTPIGAFDWFGPVPICVQKKK